MSEEVNELNENDLSTVERLIAYLQTLEPDAKVLIKVNVGRNDNVYNLHKYHIKNFGRTVVFD